MPSTVIRNADVVLAWDASAGRSIRIDSMPISAQSLCLAPTYQ